jgi:hypothetical protein
MMPTAREVTSPADDKAGHGHKFRRRRPSDPF